MVDADADEIAGWNDPGLVDGLGDDSAAEAREDDSTDTLALALSPDEIADSPGGADAQREIDTAVQYPTPPACRLRVVNVIPVAFEDRGLVLDVEGQGKTCLSYHRIEALAVGAIEGLSEKPVVVIDLVLNWTSFAGDDMHVLRVRCDLFDPRQVVSAASPLEALQALLDTLLSHADATPLPDLQSARGEPFARFASLPAYEASALKADPFGA